MGSPLQPGGFNESASEAQLLCIEGMPPCSQYDHHGLRDALGGSNSAGFVVQGSEKNLQIDMSSMHGRNPSQEMDNPPSPPSPDQNLDVYNNISQQDPPLYESDRVSLARTLLPDSSALQQQ